MLLKKVLPTKDKYDADGREALLRSGLIALQESKGDLEEITGEQYEFLAGILSGTSWAEGDVAIANEIIDQLHTVECAGDTIFNLASRAYCEFMALFGRGSSENFFGYIANLIQNLEPWLLVIGWDEKLSRTLIDILKAEQKFFNERNNHDLPLPFIINQETGFPSASSLIEDLSSCSDLLDEYEVDARCEVCTCNRKTHISGRGFHLVNIITFERVEITEEDGWLVLSSVQRFECNDEAFIRHNLFPELYFRNSLNAEVLEKVILRYRYRWLLKKNRLEVEDRSLQIWGENRMEEIQRKGVSIPQRKTGKVKQTALCSEESKGLCEREEIAFDPDSVEAYLDELEKIGIPIKEVRESEIKEVPYSKAIRPSYFKVILTSSMF